MKPLTRLFTIFTAISTLFLSGLRGDNKKEVVEFEPYQRVIVIGVDGAGAFFKDADTPNIDRIFAKGAVSYDVLTSDPTISAECWGSLLSGVTPEFHKLDNSKVAEKKRDTNSIFPTFFRVVRENMPEATLASFCNWYPINIGIIEDNIDVYKDCAGDEELTDKIVQYVGENDPTVMFVQFDGVDHAGHTYGYGTEDHLKEISLIDTYIDRIYKAYQKKGYLDDTLFIVTADHGGNGTSHGGLTDEEKYIMFAAAGKNVEKGKIKDMAIRDTASIVLYALGLADKQPEGWTSRVPTGVFQGVTAGERPVFNIEFAYEHRTHTATPTPDVNGDDSLTKVIGEDRVRFYLPFDGNAEDATGSVKTTENGKIYYIEGYNGQAARFNDGYASVHDYAQGTDTFSVAFWMKSSCVDGDPVIFSNKDWNDGKNDGLAFAINESEILFNCGRSNFRMDFAYDLPIDYENGWVYIVFVFDRDESKLLLSYDFGEFNVCDVPLKFRHAKVDAFDVLNIGQDGTGAYKCPLGAAIDEFLYVNDALTNEDVAALRAHYLGNN